MRGSVDSWRIKSLLSFLFGVSRVSTPRFDFHRIESGAASGFDLGDMEVTGDDCVITSHGHAPSQSMMIYVAISDLIFGVSRLCLQKSGTYRFVGADSSFSLAFVLSKDGKVVISARSSAELKTDRVSILNALRESTDRFLGTLSNELPTADPVARDLGAARKSLFEALSALQT